MRQSRAQSSKSNAAIVALVAVASAAGLASCGYDNRQARLYGQTLNPSYALPTTNTISGTTSVGNYPFLGNYGGKVTRALNKAANQDYVLSISTILQEGRTYAYLNFFSQGDSGNLDFEQVLTYRGSTQSYGSSSVVIYSFITEPVRVDALSSSPVGLEVKIAIRSGKEFDPAQSSIRIKECGFSQACLTDVRDAAVAAGLGKR